MKLLNLKTIASLNIFILALFITAYSQIVIPTTTVSNKGPACPSMVSYSTSVGSGNPATNNNNGLSIPTTSLETDIATSGWTAITISGTTSTTNKWSSNVAIPFPFYFYGQLQTSFKVAYNGLLTFNTSATTNPPTGNNSSMYSSSLPEKTIAYWDMYQFKGNNDKVYYKIMGTSPNMQLWIKWYAVDMGGTSSTDKSTDNYFAFVLEETSNNIFFVDMIKNSSKATTATLGLQYNSSTYSNYTSSLALTSSSSSNNVYYKFAYDIYDSEDTASYTFSTMVTSTTEKIIIPETYSCLTNTLNEAQLNYQLDVGDHYTFGNSANFSASVGIRYTLYDGSCNEISHTDQTLSLSASALPFQVEQLAINDLTSSLTSDVHHIGIKIISNLSTSGTTDITGSIRLNAWLTQDFEENVLSGDYESSSLINLNTPEITGNRVYFSWSPECELTNHYQIEILRIYNLDEDNAALAEYVHNDAIDWTKALSLEVEDETSISLYMAQGTGYYAWRVRPIGDYYEGGITDSRNWGIWSSHLLVDPTTTNENEDSDAFTMDLNSNDEYSDHHYFEENSAYDIPSYIFYITQNDDAKNWIYNRTFTENNRIAENINYASSLGQIKQSQRKLTEVDSVLMNQVEYDFVGRQAIQTLTAPVDQQDFGYYNNLILDTLGGLYGPTDFDSDIRVNDAYYPPKIDETLKNVPVWENPRKMKGPISTYYSDENPDVNIPNAGDYPYSRIVYDKLGRPKKVSLFGDEHRMGLYDETNIDGGYQRTIRTYYSAVNDTELMGVFGNMTPADTSVYKIIRVDPNEVATVEYKTLEGRTIATAMVDAADNQLLDDIYEGDTWYTKLISTQTQLDEYGYVKEQIINFSVPGVDIYVDYWLDVESFSANCIDYCSTCDYDITLYAVREETNSYAMQPVTFTINPSDYAKECDGEDLSYTMPQYSLFISDPGNYIIGRKITVNNKIDNATRYRDLHSAKIDTLLTTEATKFDELSSYVAYDTVASALYDLYDFIESLPSGESSACGETSSVIGGDFGGLGLGSTLIGSGLISNQGLNSGNSKNTSDIWLVSTNKDNDGNISSYTVASNCLEVEIPRIECNWNPCEAIWKTSVPSPSYGYEQDLITENGGYYDFESMLYDKYEDEYGKYLYNYFYDKNGDQIYSSGTSYKYQIKISSNTAKGYCSTYNAYNSNASTSTYTYNEFIKSAAEPCFTITIDPDGSNGSEPAISIPLDYGAIPWNLDKIRCNNTTTYANSITVNGYVEYVANMISLYLAAYSKCDYTVSYTTNDTYGTITIASTFSKLYPNFSQSIALSGISGITVSNTSNSYSYPSSTSKFKYGNGYINSMLNHMLYETVKVSNGITDSAIYGDCYDIYFKWEDFVNNFDALYASKGNSNVPSTDFLQALLDEYGTIYSGFSNHKYGYSSSSKEYGYGYLEYAYKSFLFDTIDWKYKTYNYATESNSQISTCTQLWGIDFDRQPSVWSNPISASGSTEETWDVSTCGNAWWDGNSIIVDELDESAECKAWKNFYGCLQTGFENVDDLILGDESTYSGTITDNVLSKIAINIIDSTSNFLEKRKAGFKLRIKSTDASISNGLAGLYSDLIISNVKTELSSLTISKNSSNQVTGVGSNSQLNTLKNIWDYNIDFSTTSSKIIPAGYKQISSQNFKKGDKLAEWLNNKLAAKTELTSDEINTEIENFSKEYGLSSTEFSSKKSYSLTSTCSFTKKSTSTSFQFVYNAMKKTLNINNTNSTALQTQLLSNISPGDYISTSAFNFKFNNKTLHDKLSAIGMNASIKAVQYRGCDPRNISYVYNVIQDALAQAKECRLEKSLSRYDTQCTLKSSIDDSLKIRYRIDYHQYTLFYYDMAGNLVKSVPPAGVNISDTPTRNDIKNHSLATTYAYNSLGQNIYENSPDGGEKQFWYNEFGQVRFSQNEKQKSKGSYSYIKYDALGRSIEAGESSLSATSQAFVSSISDENFPSSNCSNVVTSVYDEEINGLYYISSSQTLEQHYLQNRISYACSDPNPNKSGDEMYTYYSYDPHGNIEWMLQSIPGLDSKKYIAYEYDLISGKVTKVKYNEGKADQFFHQYTYDSDGRIEKTETSRDGYIWDTDARYEYYAYGPLKRLSIGEDNIQGLDYVYTINGWLKGVNHQSLNSTYDPGSDGATTSAFATDVYGTTLGYFEGDFKRKYGNTYSPFNSEFSSTTSDYYITGNTQMDWYRPTAAERGNSNIAANPTDNSINYQSLYNGSITNMVYNTSIPGTGAFSNTSIEDKSQGFKFNYDELYRLTQANYDFYSGSNWYKETLSNPGSYLAYKSTYSYDKNGNTDTLVRYGTDSAKPMDKLCYAYNSATNQLNYVKDISGYSSSIKYDLESQFSGNYTYSAIGELEYDRAEGINKIFWLANGKADSITYKTGKQIAFEYDALGNKVSQKVYSTSSDVIPDITYYVCDINGKTMAIYKDDDDANLKLNEFPIYSGKRIGEYKSVAGIDPTTNLTSTTAYSRTVGEKYYELNDHLGNVRTVVEDVKNSDGTAAVISAADYYPFGMVMPGRDYSSSNYRYGYQGKEREDEVKSNGNNYDFGARILDPRIGRWLSIDPLAAAFPSESPYAAMGNNPVNMIDPDGKMKKFHYIPHAPEGYESAIVKKWVDYLRVYHADEYSQQEFVDMYVFNVNSSWDIEDYIEVELLDLIKSDVESGKFQTKRSLHMKDFRKKRKELAPMKTLLPPKTSNGIIFIDAPEEITDETPEYLKFLEPLDDLLANNDYLLECLLSNYKSPQQKLTESIESLTVRIEMNKNTLKVWEQMNEKRQVVDQRAIDELNKIVTETEAELEKEKDELKKYQKH